jgi:hypothetical protein
VQDEILYVIGIGSVADWEAGRGSLYWIEASNGEHALPVFTTRERAHEHWEAHLSETSARLQMVDSMPMTHQGPVLENQMTILPLRVEDLALAAEQVEADYLIRDPRPGSEQETLRLPK